MWKKGILFIFCIVSAIALAQNQDIRRGSGGNGSGSFSNFNFTSDWLLVTGTPVTNGGILSANKPYTPQNGSANLTNWSQLGTNSLQVILPGTNIVFTTNGQNNVTVNSTASGGGNSSTNYGLATSNAVWLKITVNSAAIQTWGTSPISVSGNGSVAPVAYFPFYHETFTTAASSNSVSYMYESSPDLIPGFGGQYVATRYKLDQTNALCVFVGWSDNTSGGITASDTPAGNSLGFFYSVGRSRSDTTWQALSCKAGVSTFTDTGIPVTTNTVWFETHLCRANTNAIFTINGVNVATNTTNLPATGTGSYVYENAIRSFTTSAQRARFAYMYEIIIDN